MPFENVPSKWRISSGARVKNLSFMRRAGLTPFSSRPQLSTDGRGLATNLFQSRDPFVAHRSHNAKLSQMSSQCIDQLRALAHHQIRINLFSRTQPAHRLTEPK